MASFKTEGVKLQKKAEEVCEETFNLLFFA